MYNRYIRAADGGYTRVPQPDAPPGGGERAKAAPFNADRSASPPPGGGDATSAPPPGEDKEKDFISRLLGKFHLDDIDTGDLIILLLLFYLFRQEADEELLVALGLLLIL